MVYTDGTYVIADTIRELQRFVIDNELPRQFLNSGSFFPHYRLTEDILDTVLETQIKQVSQKELQRIARDIRGSSS